VYKPAAWMSAEAQDLISRMLTLDPDQRITLEQVWAHPWVASVPRWQPPGVGAGRLYRALTDPTTGAVLPDDAGGLIVGGEGGQGRGGWQSASAAARAAVHACCCCCCDLRACMQPPTDSHPFPPPLPAVLAQLEALGADAAAIRRALRSRECNSLTASYHLVFEARAEAQRAAAAAGQRDSGSAANAAAGAAAATAAVPRKPAAAAGDWAWDFATITAKAASAAANGPAPAAASSGSSSGMASHASAGSSSLRGSGSPARPRTAAAAPAGSPTRFGQEAAAAVAAGYFSSPRRPTTGAPPGASWEAPRSGSPASPLQLAAVSARQHAAAAAAAALEWDIKAVRGPEGAAAAAAPSTAAALPLPPVPPLVLATTTVAEGSPPGTSKSPCLSPLPAAVSSEQLQLVPGGSGGGAAPAPPDRSPPIAQAV
jgi:hypothetical protein